MVRELTCIVCPKGCPLKVDLENGAVANVAGHTCPRGKQYAIDECTHPMRTITTTVRATDGSVVPVKTATTVPKELMLDCMKEINNAVLSLPAHIGDVVIANILGTGADVIVTANAD